MTHRIGGFHNATSMAAKSPETELMGIRTRESGLARASAVEAAIRKMKPHYDALIACEDNLKFPRPLNPLKTRGRYPNVKNNHVEKTNHPCQFPVELVERLVLSLTNRGDAVLDPYMGVGSAVVAALKHERIGHGCDIVPEYVDIARERVRQLRAGVLKSRPMDKPVYDPAKPYGGHKQPRSNGRRTLFKIVGS